MRQPPSNTIAKDAIKAWRLTAALYAIIPIIVTIAAFILANRFDYTYWIGIALLAVTLIESYLTIFVIPKIRWRRYRYEIFEQEIYLQKGIIVESRTLVPMIRVQHVDTKQGPILKKYGLSTLTVSTAATTHEIPALPEEEAATLRDQISELARVDEDDV